MDAASALQQTPAARSSACASLHAKQIDVPLYAYSTSLTEARWPRGAQLLAKLSRIRAAHRGRRSQAPATWIRSRRRPDTNRFLKTVVPFLKRHRADACPSRAPRSYRARIAVTATFALNGVLFASVFSRLPSIQERAEISTGVLGLALMFTMLGLIASQAAAGALVARCGSRRLVTVGLLGWSIGLVPVAFAESFAALALGLAMIGFANGLLDVSMNVHGLTVERELRRRIFTGLHAAFSFGGLCGAAIGALVAGLGVGVTPHLLAASALTVTVALVTRPLLLPSRADAAPEGPRLAVPTRALMAVGALAFCTLLAEGAMNDWAAVYLDGELETTDAVAATGLAVYSLAMGVGRLAGDRPGRGLRARSAHARRWAGGGGGDEPGSRRECHAAGPGRLRDRRPRPGRAVPHGAARRRAARVRVWGPRWRRWPAAATWGCSPGRRRWAVSRRSPEACGRR